MDKEKDTKNDSEATELEQNNLIDTETKNAEENRSTETETEQRTLLSKWKLSAGIVSAVVGGVCSYAVLTLLHFLICGPTPKELAYLGFSAATIVGYILFFVKIVPKEIRSKLHVVSIASLVLSVVFAPFAPFILGALFSH